MAVRRTLGPNKQCSGDQPVLDIISVALVVGFFAVAVAYVHACDRL
jgi:hypothetical protein